MRVSPPSNHSFCRHQTSFFFWLVEDAAWASDLSYQTNTQSIAETSYRQHHEMRKPYETYQYCFSFGDEKRDLVTSVTTYPCTHGMLLGLKISKRVSHFKFSNICMSLQMWFTSKRYSSYALCMWKVARTEVDLLKLRVVVCHIVQGFATRVEERRSQPVDSHPLAFSTLFSDNLKILRLSPEIVALSQFYAEGLQATIKSNFLRIVKYYSHVLGTWRGSNFHLGYKALQYSDCNGTQTPRLGSLIT